MKRFRQESSGSGYFTRTTGSDTSSTPEVSRTTYVV
jgi:hypothetical protein